MTQIVGIDDTRNLPPAGMPREQRGGDGRAPRDGRPISAPESAIGFDALWASMEKCKGGVTWKGSVASFALNGAENVARLARELESGAYVPRGVTTFEVTSPKRRTIVSTPFRDRVYQRSLNDNVLYPCVTRSLIYDNAACQTGKGTDFARNRFKCHLQRHYRRHGLAGGVLCVDIRHYYQSLPHGVGEAVFDRCPEWASERAVAVLRSQYEGDRGYNPGSQMVQIVGVAALDGLDHFIKERLRVKGYVRYMDDLRLVHEDKAYLEECRAAIESELAEMGLSAHPKKTRIVDIRRKIGFLGFDFRLTGTGKALMTLRPESVKRTRRKLRRLMRLESQGLRPEGTAEAAYQAWRAHAAKGDSRRLLERQDKWFDDLRRQHD